MKKDSRYLGILSVLTTAGLCLSTILAYSSWYKADNVQSNKTENKVVHQAAKNIVDHKARYSYAS